MQSSKYLLYRHREVFYIYPILHKVSPEGPPKGPPIGLPHLEVRGQDNFFCVFYPPRILDNTVINLQKGRKTFSRKIPASCKYFKIVKIAVYVFKHAKTFRDFGNDKAKKIKLE